MEEKLGTTKMCKCTQSQ
ncbi:hypothetical protein Goarm_003566 [Gossypium armourianum]|uniref:Uncharacterized protein n=1 Tax=Gossypium armourianum TaxID=34283 RepID=A0A7J9K3N0_9ROSI|nr:hypothetical protein [Gossypium armourianum]